MKIAVVSDIHLDINHTYPILDELVAYVLEIKANMLLIAGDITNEVEDTIQSVAQLKTRLQIPVYYVPGNHDMWSSDFEKNASEDIYRRFQEDSNCLCSKVIKCKNEKEETIYIVGDIGWYDYSFGTEEYTKEEYSLMHHAGRTWQDRIKNQWTEDNIGTSNRMLKQLEDQLQQCKDGKIIALTHMVPIEEFTVPEANDMWRYFNAFLGSRSLHELYKKYAVSYVACGHIHYRKTVVKEGITYFCPCLNYESEWLDTTEKNPGKEVREAVAIFTV